MNAMDFSIFGVYEPIVVCFLVSVLVALVRWVYQDATARGDQLAPFWAGSIVVTYLWSASLYPPAVILGTALLVTYRATHTGSIRLARAAAGRADV